MHAGGQDIVAMIQEFVQDKLHKLNSKMFIFRLKIMAPCMTWGKKSNSCFNNLLPHFRSIVATLHSFPHLI